MLPLAVLLCLALALAAGRYAVQRKLPERYNPFAPLSIAERPTFLTGWKLSTLDGEPAACFAALDAAGIAYQLIPDRETGAGCGFEDAARVRETTVSWGAPGLPMTCPMIAALAVWEDRKSTRLNSSH